MTKLILRNDRQEREIDLPLEILDALWCGETDIVPIYIGWDARQGILSSTTSEKTVTRHKNACRTTRLPSAGMLRITLSVEVKANDETLKNKFLPHGTRIK